MRRGLAIALAGVAVVATAGIALADGGATIVRAGNMVLEIDGGVSPRALPAERFAPLKVHGGGKLTTIDGSHPPALEEAILDTDKDVRVDVRGLPRCRIGQLRAVATKQAKAVCGGALVGQGRATVEVAFPEQTAFKATGPLLLFNGGERKGAITVLAYAYLSVPAPTAVIATAKLTRVDKGPYGLHVVVDVPRIAGGAGSVVEANIEMSRLYGFKGRRQTFLSGRCRDKRIQARGAFAYSDGTLLSGGLVRTCKVAG